MTMTIPLDLVFALTPLVILAVLELLDEIGDAGRDEDVEQGVRFTVWRRQRERLHKQNGQPLFSAGDLVAFLECIGFAALTQILG